MYALGSSLLDVILRAYTPSVSSRFIVHLSSVIDKRLARNETNQPPLTLWIRSLKGLFSGFAQLVADRGQEEENEKNS